MNRLVAAGLFFAFALAATPVGAQGLADELRPSPAVQRSFALVPSDGALFLDAREPAPMLEMATVSREVERYLVDHPYIEFVDATEMKRRLRTVESSEHLDVAEVRLGTGKQLFLGFRFDDAIEQLTRARDEFVAGYGELLLRRSYVETLQLLSFSHLDRATPEDLVRARTYMRELVRFAPYASVDPNRHPAERVALHAAARRSVVSDRGLRSPSVGRARELADHLGVDYLAFVRAVQDGPDRYMIELDIWDATAAQFQLVDDIVVPAGATRDEIRDRVSARLSRFAACVEPLPEPVVHVPSEAGRVYLDLGFAYFVFLESPTREAFDNIGAALSFTYMFTDFLSIWSRFSLAFGGEDRKGDLLRSFNTFRLDLAVGFSQPWRWIRPFVYLGTEIASPTSFSVSRSIDCKIFGRGDPACLESQVHDFEQTVLVGLFASVGVTGDVGLEPFYFTAAVTSALYVFPFDDELVLNFPLGFDLGLEYRF